MENIVEDTLCVLLAGGQGTRLFPLTAERAKPGVPFGGKYRIIDFTLSNCLHSGLRRVLVLTQYKSHSLQKHLRDAWSIYNPELGEYITAIPPQMRTGESWYCGTADALHQNLYLLSRSGAKRVLILSGDHIYRMDYASMLQEHMARKADLSIACMPVPVNQSSAFGILGVDSRQQVVEFAEKPSNPAPMIEDSDHALASMGIYVFNTELLHEQLDVDHASGASSHDFGHDLIPRLIHSHRVHAYRFGGSQGRVSQDRYWRDVGTLESYYEANMDLLADRPAMDLYQHSWPIRTYQGQHPPARVAADVDNNQSTVHNSMLGNGSMVRGAKVIDSILSAGTRVDSGAVVQASILFDNVHVGADVKLRRCIVDKHASIPAGMCIGFDSSLDRRRFHVTDSGIVVVNRHSLEALSRSTGKRKPRSRTQLST